MATSLSLITEYIARQADPKDMPSIVFWALGELRRVQTSTSSIGEVLTNHDDAIKSILEAIGEGGDGTPGDCSCEDGADGKDGNDGADGRGVMVFQQSSVPSSSLSMPGDIWFSDNDILIMNLSRQWVSISGGSADIINDSIISLATTWSSSRLTSEFEQYLRKDEARHKLYGLLHSDVDTATPIAETDGLFYQSGKFRPGNRMEFIDPYVLNDTYYPQQTVLVNGSTLVANKVTTADADAASPDWDLLAGPAVLSQMETEWVRSAAASPESITVSTTDNGWTEIARRPVPLNAGLRAGVVVYARRTDAPGLHGSEHVAMGFNNGGLLEVGGAVKVWFGWPLDFRHASDGTDLIFEVRGRNNQVWDWTMTAYFRDIS